MEGVFRLGCHFVIGHNGLRVTSDWQAIVLIALTTTTTSGVFR